MTPLESAFGALGLLGLAAFPLSWAASGTAGGHRSALWAVAAALLVLAVWRGVAALRELLGTRTDADRVLSELDWQP